MSVNQSRSDRGDNTHYKKSVRSASSNQPRTSGVYAKGGAGTAPSPPINSNSSSVPINRSFKKVNNAQGGQSRVNLPSPDSRNSTTAALNAPNGVHVQQQLHGKPNIPVSSGSAAKPTEVAVGKPNIPVSSISAAKPTEVAATQQRSSSRAVPKAPSSQPTTLSSDIGGPATPEKPQGSGPKGFAFQFGSLSPSCMQIPARTSSAPPNLDEQKRDQARHESLKSGPSISNAVPKQHGERKAEQLNVAEVQPVLKARRDAPVLIAPLVSQTQKPSSLPIPATTIQMQFHQPHVPAQFSGPNSQIQSQGLTGTSIPMQIPMSLSIGNSSQLQPQVFVQGLPHPMQSQGIMHHGGFTSQMGPQLSPNIGNIGIGINPQYPLQQGGKFVSPRKSIVKITHPQTHEELKLDPDVSSVQRSHLHPSVAHSQPIPTFGPSHSVNYYPTNFNPSTMYFQFQNTPPVVSSKVTSTSQAPRSNYSASHVSQSVPFMNQNAAVSINKAGLAAGPLNPEYARNVHTMISAPLETVQVRVTHASGSTVEKVAESVPRRNSAVIGDRGPPKFSAPTGEGSTSHSQMDTEACSGNSLHHPKPAVEVLVSKPVASKETEGVATSAAMESVPSVNYSELRKENLRGSAGMDHEKNLGKSANVQAAYQVGGQSLSAVNLPLGVAEKSMASSYTGDSQGVETKEIGVSSSRSEFLSKSIADKTPIHSAYSTFVSESELTSARTDLASSFSEKSSDGSILRTMDTGRTNQLNDYSLPEQVGQEETGKGLPEGSKEDGDDFSLLATGTSESPLVAEQVIPKAACTSDHCLPSETLQKGLDENANKKPGDTFDRDMSTYRKESTDVENSSGDSISILDASTTNSDIKSCEVLLTRTGMQDVQPDPHTADITQATSKYEGESVESSASGITSLSISTSKDKSISEMARPKSSTAKGKKKMKDLLLKADAAGTTSDLYMAYKGPEERMESSVVSDNTDISVDVKQLGSDVERGDGVESEKGVHNKAEPDDWEDAADISALKLESPANAEKISGNHYAEKKYSKDFLLQFADKCKDLPEGFGTASDLDETLMSTTGNVFHPVNSHPSLGRGTDWHAGGPRNDRRVGGRDLHLDIGHGGNLGFRGQGGNFGGSRNTRAPVQYGGILSEPKQFIGTQQGGVPKNSPDSDRWHHTTNFHQKGLIPSPHTALQVMHRAERKYEVGKVTGEEQAKQRQLKAILNKLTPQNFEKLFEQVKAVNIDNAVTLSGVIAQIFDKALTEPTFCEMYADFCFHLSGEIPEFCEDDEKITFKRLLLNKCQEEFERGEKEQEEANKGDEEGEVKLSKEEREVKKTKARRRMLGNIRLIGELYKKRMLTERIMHSCINKLLGHQCQNPDEEDVEALCKLMSTIGAMIDHPKAKEHIDAYFDMMEKLSTNMKLSSRVRFMLKDAIDLRRRKWQQRMKVEGPKKIDEVHRDAAQERQAQASRLARNPSMNPSRRPQMDFSPRGPNAVPSPNSQMGPGFRMLPNHNHRGFGGQDVRSNEARTPIPLPHRPTDDAITLGPQTSLGRGMSISSVSSDRTQREDVIARHAFDRYAAAPAANDHSSVVDHSMYNQNTRARGNGSEVSVITSPPPRRQLLNSTGNVLSEKVLTEAHLRDMSIAAIREFYSAHDENEVSLCVKELNSPSFHPSMISIWVSDSFERKDMERDLLARLLVNLTRPAAEAVVSQVQLVKGLESVLTTFEDAVNDAPKAPEFLGRLFARMIVESVVPLREIGQLLSVGGEETGQLVDVGLAGDVLGRTLEMIKSEKGESVLNDLIAASNLQLEDFRSRRRSSKTLENFILDNNGK